MSIALGIKALGVVSALGNGWQAQVEAHHRLTSGIVLKNIGNREVPVAEFSGNAITAFLAENSKYRQQDRMVWLALLAAEELRQSLDVLPSGNLVFNMGSSRGATHTWEEAYRIFMESGTVPLKTSPVTTLASVSSNVAKYLGKKGWIMDHSVTCGTGLQSVANAFAWLGSGMSDYFLAGASEAPVTPFTIAQMQALGIYSGNLKKPYSTPLSLDKNRRNTMVLGEGAALLLLEKAKAGENYKAIINGYGSGMESADALTGITDTGIAFQQSMKGALEMAQVEVPDLVIMHAPGTIKGENAELAAMKALFGNTLPPHYSNKWLYGHTLGVSGLMNVVSAIIFMQSKKRHSLPYPAMSGNTPGNLRTVLINAMGFGGNAVSLSIQHQL